MTLRSVNQLGWSPKTSYLRVWHDHEQSFAVGWKSMNYILHITRGWSIGKGNSSRKAGTRNKWKSHLKRHKIALLSLWTVVLLSIKLLRLFLSKFCCSTSNGPWHIWMFPLMLRKTCLFHCIITSGTQLTILYFHLFQISFMASTQKWGSCSFQFPGKALNCRKMEMVFKS